MQQLGVCVCVCVCVCCSEESGELSGWAGQVVDTCISVYNAISSQLLPTPSRSHYTFNLRDLSSVVQGLLMADASKLEVSFSTAAPSVCNSLPVSVQNCDTLTLFKSRLKAHLFSSVFAS